MSVRSKLVALIGVTLALLAVATAGCTPASTPTSTPTPAPSPTPTPLPLRAQDVGPVEERQLAAGGMSSQVILWWSGDGREYITSRSARDDKLREDEILRSKCGDHYTEHRYVWRVRDGAEPEFLVESLDGPSVSPGGRYLLYIDGLRCDSDDGFTRSFRLLDLATGQSMPIGDAPPTRLSPIWIGDEALLVPQADGLYLVSTATGTSRKLNDLVAGSATQTLVFPSPGGKRLAYMVPDGLWVMDAEGDNRRKLAGGTAPFVAWSPDGSRVAYSVTPDAKAVLHVVSLEGDGPPEVIVLIPEGVPSQIVRGAWSPYGVLIAVTNVRKIGPITDSTSIYLLNADGTSLTRLIELKSRWGDVLRWSKDSRVVFYIAVEMTGLSEELWAIPLDTASGEALPSAPMSLYVPPGPKPAPSNIYVYLEPESVSLPLRLEAAADVLQQEGITLVRNKEEMERAVGEDTRAIVLNREGISGLDVDWLQAQYEAGTFIFGAWLKSYELRALLAGQSPPDLPPLSPNGQFECAYARKTPDWASYDDITIGLFGSRLTLNSFEPVTSLRRAETNLEAAPVDGQSVLPTPLIATPTPMPER